MLEPLQPDGYQKPRSSKKKFIIIGLLVILPVLFVGGILAIIFGTILFATKQTEEYKCAMTELKKNQEAVRILGEPMEAGFFSPGNFSISNRERSVDFQTSITGSKSAGTLYVNSFRNPVGTNFQMVLETDGKEVTLYNNVYPCRQI